ncbi:chemotaxis protein CheW [Candidatus Electronema sp. PJ]|uniref:chemotaxis protein CheW n=1 Tax=Candidatus Electronema sp. PJ TaxID=3401572 RepID=UPI003AA93E62
MSSDKDKKRTTQKAVAVRMAGGFDREPVLLFAARQAEEVLPAAQVQPLPFAPDWLLGLCAWRRQVLPVLDAAKLYGLDSFTGRSLYLVVRAAAPTGEEDGTRKLLRCVLKISSQITARDLPKQCAPASAEESGLNPALVRGLFAHEDGLLIVPDLLPALCPAAADNLFQMPAV